MKGSGVVVVLGYESSPQGKLNEISLARCDRAIEISQAESYEIALTGGFGSHFNTSPKPHAFFLRQYMLSKGVAKTMIVAMIESQNTIEDATLLRPVVERFEFDVICIVTSDFHIERATFVFGKVFKGHQLICESIPSDPETAQRHKGHETKSLKEIRELNFF